jgi:hypothetical protein
VATAAAVDPIALIQPTELRNRAKYGRTSLRPTIAYCVSRLAGGRTWSRCLPVARSQGLSRSLPAPADHRPATRHADGSGSIGTSSASPLHCWQRSQARAHCLAGAACAILTGRASLLHAQTSSPGRW